MQEGEGKPASYDELEQALSLERFGRYLGWAGGERGQAVELYSLNTQLSEALYTPLQMLEVALRNRIHAVMTEAHHDAWFHDGRLLLGEWQPSQLAKAVEDIEKERKEVTPGRIVAALHFQLLDLDVRQGLRDAMADYLAPNRPAAERQGPPP